MGQAQSTSSVKLTNDITQNVAFKVVQNCKIASVQYQDIDFSNSQNITLTNVDINQLAKYDISCIMTNLKTADFSTQLQNALDQATKSSAELLGGNSKSKTISDVVNKITQNLTSTTVNDCVSSIFQKQSFSLKNSTNVAMTNVNISQSLNIASQCFMQDQTLVQLANNLDNFIKQSAEAESKGLGFSIDLSGLGLGTISSTMVIGSSVSFGCLCLCLLLIITLFLVK